MNKFVVTTTINPPTKALKIFESLKEWDLIIAGDMNTPHYLYASYKNYLSPEWQKIRYPELSSFIGWNCIQRRNIAILEALNRGADVIALVDDDNVPLENWGQDILITEPVEVIEYSNGHYVMDPLSATEYKNLWHRGYPIQMLYNRSPKKEVSKVAKFDIQANLWNGDPDIDAICRMEHKPNCVFREDQPAFSFDALSPFNSQNTILTRTASKAYFLFPGIGRMDDIWASYKLQAEGFKTLYYKATVFQERNQHNLTQDFIQEILGYTKTQEMIEALLIDPNNMFKFLPKDSEKMYEIYLKSQE